jgi:hypothetical protein
MCKGHNENDLIKLQDIYGSHHLSEGRVCR